MNFKKLCVVVLLVSSFSVFADEAPKSGGIFWIKNSSNRVVTVKVGNFIPSKYVISPHGSNLVTVSSNNQNIEISEISETK